MDFENIESGELEDLLIRYIQEEVSEAERNLISRYLKTSKELHQKYVSLKEIYYVMEQGSEIGDKEQESLINWITRHMKPSRISYIVEYKHKKFQITSPHETEVKEETPLLELAYRGVDSGSAVISRNIGGIEIKMYFTPSKRNRISISFLLEPNPDLMATLSIDSTRVETIRTMDSSFFETAIDQSSNIEIDFYEKNLIKFSIQIDLKIS